MLKFFDQGSSRGQWINGESANDLPFVVLENIENKTAIMKWANADIDFDVYACAYGDEEVDDPRPHPPKPTQDIADWEIEVEELKAAKPESVFKHSSFFGAKILLNEKEIKQWEYDLGFLTGSNPENKWKIACQVADDNIRIVNKWVFVFNTFDEAALFKLTWC